MFTGIVTRTAEILDWANQGDAQRLTLAAQPRTTIDGSDESWDDLSCGESICINGVCLTLVGHTADELHFDVVPETLAVSALGDLGVGASVNLERAMRVGDRFGGHYVLGHVDGVGRVAEMRPEDGQTVLRVEIVSEPDFRVIHKGSVTIDGVSLTVTDVDDASFAVALIPHTLEVTSLGSRTVGERLNLEMDHVGKWVMELLKGSHLRAERETT